MKSEELIGIDGPIITAMIVVGMRYKEELSKERRDNIREHSKYRLYKYYGQEKEEPQSILTEKDKDITNIIVDMVIEFYDKTK